MAFPTPSHPESSHALAGPPRRAAGRAHVGSPEGDHQREKLQFALAVALSRGDQDRCRDLRAQIAVLGDGGEEPGT